MKWMRKLLFAIALLHGCGGHSKPSPSTVEIRLDRIEENIEAMSSRLNLAAQAAKKPSTKPKKLTCTETGIAKIACSNGIDYAPSVVVSGGRIDECSWIDAGTYRCKTTITLPPVEGEK